MAVGHVFVLCAEWCGVCRGFREQFEAAARAVPTRQFHWLDVEDWPQTADADLEAFPTVVLVHPAGHVEFFGPTEPRADAIERLVRDVDRGRMPPVVVSPADGQWIDALVSAVRARHDGNASTPCTGD